MAATKLRICQNCVYYVPYYKKCITSFRNAYCGRCVNDIQRRKRKKDYSRIFDSEKASEFFEEKNFAKESAEDIRAVMEALPEIAEKIVGIYEILKKTQKRR